jgi:predicted  nucleic acid-binding Zn-ribbon protein
MNEEPTKDLATRAFQKRVLDEFAAVRRDQAVFKDELFAIRAEQGAMRQDIAEIRTEIAEIRVQQSAMAKNIVALDHRLTTLEERVDERLKETRPIWEAVQAQMQRLLERFEAVLLECSELRGDVRIHGRRLGELERRVLS